MNKEQAIERRGLKMTNDEKKFKSLKNNAQGHFFEKEIERACNYYREKTLQTYIRYQNLLEF